MTQQRQTSISQADRSSIDTCDDSHDKHVIVAGYGPVGRVTVDALEAAGLVVTIIETNPATVQRVSGQGKRIVLGDVTSREALIDAGIDTAVALILAIPNEDVAVAACQVARELHPDIFISARTNFLSKGMLATRAGADHVVVEEVVTAQAMQEGVMKRLLHSRESASS